MKRYLLFIAFFFVSHAFLTACKKTNDGPDDKNPKGDYYIRYKANGQAYSYTGEGLIHAASLRLSATNAHQLLIIGRLHRNDQNRDAFSLIITDAVEVKTARTYQLNNWLEWPEHNQSVAEAFGSHYDASGTRYFAQLRQMTALPFEVKDDATARLTAITTESIKGTFTMKAYTTYPELKEVIITEGEFHVPLLLNTNP